MVRIKLVETIVTNTAMVALKAFQQLLWLARYPSFISSNKGDGIYNVGAIQTRLSHDSVACQIHYPISIKKQQKEKGTASKKFTPYFRPNAIKGLADYSKVPISALQYLQYRQHPCSIDTEPIYLFEDDKDTIISSSNDKELSSQTKTNQKMKQFPIVLFSHGLGGCMEMYTQYCQQLSSYGYIVIALEHEDGSGAYAEKVSKNNNKHSNDGTSTSVDYKRPDDSPYTREKVVNFRQPFLQQRVQEINTIVDIVLLGNKKANEHEQQQHNDNTNTNVNDTTSNTSTSIVHPLLDKILQICDTSIGITYIGHSFGGASVILATQHQQQQKERELQKQLPSSVIVFDPWCFSLSDDILKCGIGSSSIPIVSILSENWAKTNPETKTINYWLQNCSNNNKISSYYIPNTCHASISDPSIWLPRFIGKRVYMCHPKEQKHMTIPCGAKICSKHIYESIKNTNTKFDNNCMDKTKNNVLDNYLQEYKFQSSSDTTTIESTTTSTSLQQQQQVEDQLKPVVTTTAS